MKRWLLRMLAWDGILPVTILAIPFIIRLAFPQMPDVIVVVAVALPIAAFFLRLYAGCCYIAANHCGQFLRRIQSVSLMTGIFALMLLDALVISLQGMPGDPLWRDPAELTIFGGIYAFYIVCMAITLYPGKPDADPIGFDAFSTQSGG